MLTKLAMFLGVVSLFFLEGCQSIRKGGSQLQHSGFQPDYDFHQSIGLLVRRVKTPAEALGTGTVVADLGDRFVGVTVRAALDACFAAEPPLAPSCWLRFPVNAEQTRFVYERVVPFQEERAVREFTKNDPEALAFFEVEKAKNTSLVALELAGNIPPTEPLNALTVGYGAKNASALPGENETTMLRAAGVAWDPGAGASKGTLVTTFPSVIPGAPVFAFVPSPVDYRMMWKVIGFGLEGAGYPLRVRPFRDLMVLKSRHPTWALWTKLSYDPDMTPNKTGSLEIVSATAKEEVENFLSVRLILPTSEWDLRRFYFNGIGGRHLQEISLNAVEGKGVLDARVRLSPPVLPPLYPDLIVEFRTVSDFLMFAACFRGSVELGVEAPMTCGPSPQRGR